MDGFDLALVSAFDHDDGHPGFAQVVMARSAAP
jgi:hypothetical protein